MDWRPIETAPRDGSDVLAWGYSLDGAPLWLTPLHKDKFVSIVSRNGEHWYEYGSDCDFIPTHWMPLPDPPA